MQDNARKRHAQDPVYMRAELENWNNGWYGLQLNVRLSEIPRLIRLFQELQQDPEQHFHISSDYAGVAGLGNIEISVAGDGEPDNMQLGGVAIPPGAEVLL